MFYSFISILSSLLLLLLINYLSINVGVIESLRTGAPALACLTMRPVHGFHRAKTSVLSPFTLTQSNFEYQLNSTISVTIDTKLPDKYFRGFMVQAYDPITGNNIGRFLSTPESKPINSCSATTHVNNINKETITLIWQSPNLRSNNSNNINYNYNNNRLNSNNNNRNPRPFIQIGGRVRRWWVANQEPEPNSNAVESGISNNSNYNNNEPTVQPTDNQYQSVPSNQQSQPIQVRPIVIKFVNPQSVGQVRFRGTIVVTYEEFYTGFDSSERPIERYMTTIQRESNNNNNNSNKPSVSGQTLVILAPANTNIQGQANSSPIVAGQLKPIKINENSPEQSSADKNKNKD